MVLLRRWKDGARPVWIISTDAIFNLLESPES